MKIVRKNFNSMRRAHQLKAKNPKLDMREALVLAHKEFKKMNKPQKKVTNVPMSIINSYKIDVEGYIKNIKVEGLFTNLNKITEEYIEKASDDMYEMNGKHNPSKRPTRKSHKVVAEKCLKDILSEIVKKSQGRL